MRVFTQEGKPNYDILGPSLNCIQDVIRACVKRHKRHINDSEFGLLREVIMRAVHRAIRESGLNLHDNVEGT